MRQVVQRSRLAIAVIKGHGGRQTEQLALVLPLGANRAAVSADEVRPIGMPPGETCPGLVGTGFAAGDPEHEDGLTVNVVSPCERVIIGPDRRIAQIQQFLMDRVDGIRRDALGR